MSRIVVILIAAILILPACAADTSPSGVSHEEVRDLCRKAKNGDDNGRIALIGKLDGINIGEIKDDRFLVDLSDCYMVIGDEKSARLALAGVVGKGDAPAQVYFMLANIDMQMGRIPVAVEEFSKAIDGDPSRVDFFMARSKAYMISGDLTAAVSDLDTAISLMKNRRRCDLRECEGYSLMEEEAYTRLLALLRDLGASRRWGEVLKEFRLRNPGNK